MILANAIAEENIAIERARSARRAFFATKRFFDLTISFLMLPTLGLTTIIVKLLYLCTGDLSPIFYQQGICNLQIPYHGTEFRQSARQATRRS